ncbi:benenodin family lasso peptide [Sphingomonas sp.]|nr:benenodin family lasso peptide [Sphingomonas sp.]
MEKDVIELGIASEETKGIPVGGEPDEFGLQKLEAGLSDD